MRIIKKEDIDKKLESGKAKSTGKRKEIKKEVPKKNIQEELLKGISEQLGKLIAKETPRPEVKVKVEPPEIKIEIPKFNLPTPKLPPVIVSSPEIVFPEHPEPSRKWKFTVNRGTGGFIDEIIAERQG